MADGLKGLLDCIIGIVLQSSAISFNHQDAYFQTSPCAPKGQYVVIRYTSDYPNQVGVVETVTPMPDADGIWRVIG